MNIIFLAPAHWDAKVNHGRGGVQEDILAGELEGDSGEDKQGRQLIFIQCTAVIELSNNLNS